MPFLMVPITSSNSIDKWVFWGENVIFRYFNIFFLVFFLNRFYSRFLLIPPKWSFMIYNIRIVSDISNDTSFKCLLLCKRSQLPVLCETLPFEMNFADSGESFSELVVILPDYALRISLGTFSILLIKGSYKPKLNIKTCFLWYFYVLFC